MFLLVMAGVSLQELVLEAVKSLEGVARNAQRHGKR